MDRETLLFVSVSLVFMLRFNICSRLYLRRDHQRRIAQLQLEYEAFGHLLRSIERHLDNTAAVRGLEPAVVNSVPTFLYPSTAAATEHRLTLECAVCLPEFKENECLRLLPKCGHFFHLQCVDKWFVTATTCPICRTVVEAVVIEEDPSIVGESVEEELVVEPVDSIEEEIVLGPVEPVVEENA